MTLWSPFTSWAPSSNGNCTLAASPKKAQRTFYFLQQLEKFNLPKMIGVMRHYTAITEPILISFITIFNAAATAWDKHKLECIIFSAEKVISWKMGPPNLQHADEVLEDPSHHGHTLLESLPFGMRLPSIRTKMSLFLPHCSWLHWKGQKLPLKLNSHIPILQTSSHTLDYFLDISVKYSNFYRFYSILTQHN